MYSFVAKYGGRAIETHSTYLNALGYEDEQAVSLHSPPNQDEDANHT
jgi:hypothetical protein